MILTLSALLAAQATPARAADRAPVIMMRCHMMECGWFQPLTSEVAARGDGYALHRMSARSGRSIHRGDSGRAGYPRRYRRGLPLDWDSVPRESWVLCSRERPTAMFRSEDGSLIAHRLNLFDLPGYAESSAYIYLRVCHGIGREALLNQRRLRALGYRPDGPPTEQNELSSPDEILARTTLPR